MKNIMKNIVFVPGVWDMLHFGHIKFLERAGKFTGNDGILIVGVESDELVAEEKGREPVIKLKDRMLALEGLRCVDIAVPFYEFDYKGLLRQYGANIFVLVEENKDRIEERFVNAVNYIKEIGGKAIYLPYSHDISSTMIKEKVLGKILETANPWASIWDRVGKDESIDDVKVVSDVLTENNVKTLAEYVVNRLGIKSNDTVLDFGCGSGVMLKNINCRKFGRFGIDISEGMIERASRNCPDGIFLVSDHIPYRSKFDHIICYGVLHYLPFLEYVDKIIDEMKRASNSIIIMEIPDIAKKELREGHRSEMGKNKYPGQLYFDKKWFTDRGFKVFDNEISLTNNSDYGFTILYKNCRGDI